MAKKRRGRSVNGILLLDKPQGKTSNDVLQKVKRMFGAAKAGHTGSLDPLATGMLPICFGEATKFTGHMLDADKAYLVTGKLGIKTETSDADGEVIETKPVQCNEQDILKAMQSFRGDIMQIPSMYSAIKYDGTPLYKLARKGITIERKARPVTIYSLELIAFKGDEMVLEAKVSKGTYIRNLVEDIGDMLGCGAHVSQLHRTYVAGFQDQKLIDMQTLDSYRDRGQEACDELLLPMDLPLMGWPAIQLTENEVFYFSKGNPVNIPNLELDKTYRVYDACEQFLGVATINDDGLLAPKRLVYLQDNA